MPIITMNDVVLIHSKSKLGTDTRMALVTSVKYHDNDTLTFGYGPCFEDLDKFGYDRNKYLSTGYGAATIPTTGLQPKQFGWQSIDVLCNLGYDPYSRWCQGQRNTLRCI